MSQNENETKLERFHSVKPVEGIAGETKEWRTARPVLIPEKCTSCNECWLYCPDNCIDMSSGLPEIDYTYCKGCMVCVSVCPHDALIEEPETEDLL